MSREPVYIDKPWVKKVAFAQGITVEGKLLFSSGITARAPDGSVIGVGNMRKQIETCFANLGDLLSATGAKFGDVINTPCTRRTSTPSVNIRTSTAGISSIIRLALWLR